MRYLIEYSKPALQDLDELEGYLRMVAGDAVAASTLWRVSTTGRHGSAHVMNLWRECVRFLSGTT